MQNKYKVIVAQNNEEEASIILKLIKNNYPNIAIIGKVFHTKELELLLEVERPDLLISNIFIQENSVLPILEKYFPIFFNTIFISKTKKFAIETFKYNAVAYLIKPYNVEDLIRAIDKSLENDIAMNKTLQLKNSIIKNFNKKIAVQSKNQVFIIDELEIMYCKSHKIKQTIFVLDDKTELISNKSISEYENILTPQLFFRNHKSFIINTNYLKKIDKSDGCYCVLKDNILLPLASRRVNDLLKNFK